MNNSDFGFLRVAAVSPFTQLGDSKQSAVKIAILARKYAKKGAKLIVFPELSLTSYTCGDLFNQDLVQNQALKGLEYLCKQSVKIDALLVVGLPLKVGSAMFNVAALIDRGVIKGIVPKSYIPTSNEFYEGRWFAGADCLTVKVVKILGQTVPIGTDILFVSKQDGTAVVYIEICEDLWVAIPPSSPAAIAGATVIVNLSASNELVGKADYRRTLVEQQSARCISAYVYASAGAESTVDAVFGGHCIIAENGLNLKENNRFTQGSTGIIADLDTQALAQERLKTTSFAQSSGEIANREYRRIEVDLPMATPKILKRPNPSSLFVPKNPAQREKVCQEVFSIQAAGLSGKLRSMKREMARNGISGDPHVVIGVSGGLDSALALLVCDKAFRDLKFDRANIHAYSLPSLACTSAKTKSNAALLATALGIKLTEISIDPMVEEILSAIVHDGITQDTTYENAQARARTLILMEIANMLGMAIVIGTGNLSELALGWCTFIGDHASHYSVNCGVPKTLVRHVIGWISKTGSPKLRRALNSILRTPVSPELTSLIDGEIAQITEEKIGPYALHDFFLYHFVRRGSTPRKILYLAKLAFKGKYDKNEIIRWLKVFIVRFFAAQFKRLMTPEGPRVGLVDLSSRSGWRMPPDVSPKQWLDDLEC